MQKRNVVVAAILLAASGSVFADTQTVNTNVAFVADVSATVDQPVDFGTLVKVTGNCAMDDSAALTGVGCVAGALSGTPQVGIVTVNGASGAAIQIDVDSTAASITDLDYNAVLANSTAPTVSLGLAAVAETLTGGTQTYHLSGSLDITDTVIDSPVISVDFTVVYN